MKLSPYRARFAERCRQYRPPCGCSRCERNRLRSCRFTLAAVAVVSALLALVCSVLK